VTIINGGKDDTANTGDFAVGALKSLFDVNNSGFVGTAISMATA
jgi:hypothetical protein